MNVKEDKDVANSGWRLNLIKIEQRWPRTVIKWRLLLLGQIEIHAYLEIGGVIFGESKKLTNGNILNGLSAMQQFHLLETLKP